MAADGQVAARVANDRVVDDVGVADAHAEGEVDRSGRGVRRHGRTAVDDEAAATLLRSQEQCRLYIQGHYS